MRPKEYLYKIENSRTGAVIEIWHRNFNTREFAPYISGPRCCATQLPASYVTLGHASAYLRRIARPGGYWGDWDRFHYTTRDRIRER